MVDNDQFRRARGVRGFLGREVVQRMDWLARPPDTNPIEHEWEESRSMWDEGKTGT